MQIVPTEQSVPGVKRTVEFLTSGRKSTASLTDDGAAVARIRTTAKTDGLTIRSGDVTGGTK